MRSCCAACGTELRSRPSVAGHLLWLVTLLGGIVVFSPLLGLYDRVLQHGIVNASQTELIWRLSDAIVIASILARLVWGNEYLPIRPTLERKSS
jgi:hypothetical protein